MVALQQKNITLGNIKTGTTGSGPGDSSEANYIDVNYFKITNGDRYITGDDLYIGTGVDLGPRDPNCYTEDQTVYAGLTGTLINQNKKNRSDLVYVDNRGIFSYSSMTGTLDTSIDKYKLNIDKNTGFGYSAYYFRPTAVKKENLDLVRNFGSCSAFKNGTIIAVSNWYSDNDNFVTYVMYNNNEYTAITPNLNATTQASSNFLQDEVPTSSTSPGTKGATSFDRNYIYHCYDDNQWSRFPRDLSW